MKRIIVLFPALVLLSACLETHPSDTDKDALVKAIMWERMFELTGEGGEWFSERRRGAQFLVDFLLKPLQAFWEEPEQASNYWATGLHGITLPTSLDEVRKRLLCAYPDYEIRFNTALSQEDQNDFYVR